jgi:PAS domain S-box-containing protein
MVNLSSIRAILHQRFGMLGLRQKIIVSLLAVALPFGVLFLLSVYYAASYQIRHQVQILLEGRANVERREIELLLAAVAAVAESIAGNTVTANALADSRGREIYLVPLLRNQKLAIPGTSITVVDYRGRPVASNIVPAPDYTDDPTVASLISAGTASAFVREPGAPRPAIQLVLPIRYQLTRQSEGAVVLRIPLDSMLAQATIADSQWLSIDGVLVAGSRSTRPVFSTDTPLKLATPMEQLGFNLTVARDKTEAVRSLNLILLLFLILGILVILGVVAFARTGAGFVTKLLADISVVAEQIAASGRPVARIPVRNEEEFGRLIAAFNTMVDRLAESYAELERRVDERTREYHQSRLAAERASQLLREAVSSMAQGFTIYDESDCLVLCNEAYLDFYAASRDLIVPGASFEEIVRKGAERGQYPAAEGNLEAWVAHRVEQHQNASGEVIEQRLSDGRWLLIVEYRTPSGYIVGNRIDITELKATAEALRERELYLRATLDNLPFFFWLKDAESRFLAVNKVFSDACGQADPEHVVGKTDFDVWPAELAERYRRDDLEVMSQGGGKSVEEPVAGGSELGWIETYKKAVVGPNGGVLGTVGFARDISERKRMEHALLESEQRWQLAVSGANDGIWDWNPKTGKVFFSDRWKEMLGYSPDEIGDSVEEWLSRIHPRDLAATQAALQYHLRGESRFYLSEHRLLCKNGDYKWILDRGRAILNADGEAIRMAGSHTDISERRAAEERDRERTAQLNAIFTLSPDAFISFGRDHRVAYVSPAFESLTGLGAPQMVGLDEAGFSAILGAQCTAGGPLPEMAVLRRYQFDGDRTSDIDRAIRGNANATRVNRHTLEIAGPPRRILQIGMRESPDERVTTLIYLRDITHEFEVERLKSEFLSTAAHELRTPMANIFGYTELLLQSDIAADETAEFLETIYRQSQLMISIINELLDLARIEARRGKDFVIRPIDAVDMVRETVAAFKPPTGRIAPKLAPCDLQCEIRGDRRKLIQAINNVLSNAYKYSPSGSVVRIDFGDDPGTAGGDIAEESPMFGIHIVDQGIGMTPEQAARVCERFYRADASGQIPGTGLGMSIVQEIVELHGGRLDIDSRLGKGTRVSLWLPMADVPVMSA